MCLILLAWRSHPGYPLVLAANRDERHARPTVPARFWEDAPEVLAGRDLEAGGTWLGVTRSGRIAAVSNFREPQLAPAGAPSRGHLVSEYLRADEPAAAFLDRLDPPAFRYPAFNLLVGDGDGIFYFTNRGAGPESITPGLHGISNGLLDAPWPKVERGKARLAHALETPGGPDLEALFALLADRTVPPDAKLPDTGVGLETERLLGPIFIVGDHYGTRSSSVIVLDDHGNLHFTERGFGPGGVPSGISSFHLDLLAPTPPNSPGTP